MRNMFALHPVGLLAIFVVVIFAEIIVTTVKARILQSVLAPRSSSRWRF
jgi:hypothetical protein